MHGPAGVLLGIFEQNAQQLHIHQGYQCPTDAGRNKKPIIIIVIIIIIITTTTTIFTFFDPSEDQKMPKILLLGTFVKYV